MIQPDPTSPDCSCTGPADDAHYHVDQIDDCVVVTADGQIDADSLPGLLDAIDVATAFTRRVVIDLTRVTFLDRAGFEALNDALAWVRGSDDDSDDCDDSADTADSAEWVSLVGPAGVVQTALQGAAPHETVSVHDHVDDAEVALSSPAAC